MASSLVKTDATTELWGSFDKQQKSIKHDIGTKSLHALKSLLMIFRFSADNHETIDFIVLLFFSHNIPTTEGAHNMYIFLMYFSVNFLWCFCKPPSYLTQFYMLGNWRNFHYVDNHVNKSNN